MTADCNCLSRHFGGIFGGIRKTATRECPYPAILAGYLAGFASAIAAMFPNDAAAICPPKMRLTVGMETPLRHRIYIRNPALDQIDTNFLWSECCALRSWDNPTHLRKRVMIDWIGKRNDDHWFFTSPRAKNIRHVPLQRIGAGKQARVVWKFRKHLPVIWVIAPAVGEIFFQMR